MSGYQKDKVPLDPEDSFHGMAELHLRSLTAQASATERQAPPSKASKKCGRRGKKTPRLKDGCGASAVLLALAAFSPASIAPTDKE